MASVYVGVYRATSEGFQSVDFTTGSSSTGALEIELRILDTVTSRDDVVKALEALERYITENLFTGAIR